MLLPLWRKLRRDSEPTPVPPPINLGPSAPGDRIVVEIGGRLFSDGLYITSDTDTPDSTCADPRLAGDITYQRAAAPIFWSERGASSLGSVDLIALGGGIDDAIHDIPRDAPVRIYAGTQDQALANMRLVGSGVVDRVNADSEALIRVVTADVTARLSVPLQQYSFASEAPESLRGRPRMIAVGAALSCPLPMIDTSTLIFGLHDGPIAGVAVVRDRGVALTEGAGYEIDDSARYAALRHIVGGEEFPRLITVDFSGGAVRHLGEFIAPGEGDFSVLPWVSGDPDGWEVNGAGTGRSISEDASGARIESDGSGFLALVWDGGNTDDALAYHWEVDIESIASGSLVLGDGVIWADVDAPGLSRGVTLAPDGGAFSVAAASGGCDLIVRSIRVVAVRPIHRLPDVVHYLCVERTIYNSQGRAVIEPGPLALADIDWDSVDALDTAAPYSLAFWVDGSQSRIELLREVMDSFGGWIYADYLGRLAVGRLELPAGSPAEELTEIEIAGDVVPTLDQAPGLSSVVAGGRNWYVHGPNDIAGSVTPGTASLLQADYRFRRSSIDSFGADYVGAVGAQGGVRPSPGSALADARSRSVSPTGVGTMLASAADVSTEAARWGVLYFDRRSFWQVSAELSTELSDTLSPGDEVRIVAPRWGLDGGRNLVVARVRGVLGSGRVELLLWGPTREPSA